MAFKSCTYVASALHAILGLALLCAAVWLYVEVKYLTDFRNVNHYLLDFNVYWPQLIPWLFILTGFFVICNTVFGIFGIKKASKGLVFTHIVFVSVTIVFAIAAAIVALVFIDSKVSINFIKETIFDVFAQIKDQLHPNPEAETAFANIEKRMQCCGAIEGREYRSWRSAFPQSCCDMYYRGFLDQYTVECDFANQQANERHGCAEVATQYASIAVKVMSAVSLLTALVGIIVLLSSIAVLKSIRRKEQRARRNIVIAQESESKKVLL